MFTSRRAFFVARDQLPRHAPRAQRLARLYSTQEGEVAAPVADNSSSSTSSAAAPVETSSEVATPATAARSTSRYTRSNPFTRARGSPSTSSSSTFKPSQDAAKTSTVNTASPRAAKQPQPLRPQPSTSAFSSTAAPTASPPSVDWSNTFFGISAQPVSPEQAKLLSEPLPIEDIEVKPDGVIYLPEIKYRRKLNEVFGPMGWGMIPKGEAVVGESIVTREYALIINSRFVSQAQGENQYFSADQLPSAVEGCKSNALMRCCKDIGIGSELWDPTFVRWFKKNNMEEVWVEHATTKKKRTLWYKRGEVNVQYPYKATK